MAREYDIEKALNNLGIEPEWCEPCSTDAEKSGIEYEFNWYEDNGVAYCEHCNRPI